MQKLPRWKMRNMKIEVSSKITTIKGLQRKMRHMNTGRLTNSVIIVNNTVNFSYIFLLVKTL